MSARKALCLVSFLFLGALVTEVPAQEPRSGAETESGAAVLYDLRTGEDLEIIKVMQGEQFEQKSLTISLKDAQWRFYDDHRFSFNDLSGTYRREGNRLEFAAQQDGISIDGSLYLDERLVIDAVYAFTASPQRVVRFSQELKPNPVAEKKVEDIDDHLRDLQNPSKRVSDETFFAELQTLGIDTSQLVEERNYYQDIVAHQKEEEADMLDRQTTASIFLPSIEYNVRLEGELDEVPFGPVEATLEIEKAPLHASHPLRVSLVAPSLFGISPGATKPAEKPGNLWLSNVSFSPDDPSASTIARASEIEIRFLFEDENSLGSFDLGSSDSIQPVPAAVEKGRFRMSFDGDRLHGEIDLVGRQTADDQGSRPTERHTYRATVEGKQVKGRLASFTVELAAMGIDREESTITQALKSRAEIYHISLKGKTDAGEFSSLPGLIFITRSSSDTGDQVSIHLSGDPSKADVMANGFVYLHPESSSGVKDPGVRVQAKGNQIEINITPSDTWLNRLYGLGSGEESAHAVIREGKGRISIAGEKVVGRIELSGFRYPAGYDEYDFDIPSFYEAEFEGSVRKSLPVERLKKELAIPFNGEWSLPANDTWNLSDGNEIGTIVLKQTGDKVLGTLWRSRAGRTEGTALGRIEGTAFGRRLDFRWSSDEDQTEGTGFLRALDSGTLIGLIRHGGDIPENEAKQTIVGHWVVPKYLVDHPMTVFDFNELKYFARDLKREGNCEQVSALLAHGVKVLLDHHVRSTSRGSLAEAVASDKENTARLLAASENYQVVFCKLELGDYPGLLNALDQSLEIATFSGPEKSAARLFRMLISKPVKTLDDGISQIDNILTGYENMLEMLNEQRGIIGISYSEQETTGKVVIKEVVDDSPAGRAGLLPDDVIVAIDHRAIEPFLEQVGDRLAGAPGSDVVLTIRRSSEEMTFTVIRGRSRFATPQRRQEASAMVSALIQELGGLRQAMSGVLEHWKGLVDAVAEGANPLEGISSVPRDVEAIGTRLDEMVSRVLDRSRRLFAHTATFPYFDELIGALGERKRMMEVSGSIEKMKGLSSKEEKMMSLIASDSGLGNLEKQLFESLYVILVTMTADVIQLDMHREQFGRYDHERMFADDEKRAIENSEEIAERFEDSLSFLERDMEKVKALDQAQEVLNKATRLLLSLHAEERALLTSEKSRSRALLDLIDQGRDSEDGWLASSRPETTPITLEGLQRIAKAHQTTLVEYTLLSDDNLQIWVMDPDGGIKSKSVTLSKYELTKAKIENLVVAKPKKMTSEQKHGAHRDQTEATRLALPVQERPLDPEALHRLHEVLIDPIKEWLPKDPAEHVVFIPQGILYFVPFPALLDAEGTYLIKKHTMLTAPSIKVLDLTREQKERLAKMEHMEGDIQGDDILIVGNPKMPDGLFPLQGAEKEAEIVAARFNGTPMKGTEATERAVKQLLPKARLVHFATHGTSENVKSEQSGADKIPGALAFTPDSDNNGWLTSTEISKMKLQADLVVLSACNTGSGLLSSDGIIGLSRAFIGAGVPSVIVSLWSIPDMPTADLMSEFYRNWMQGTSKAHALRAAMLTTLASDDYRDPVNWAAFTLIGEAE